MKPVCPRCGVGMTSADLWPELHEFQRVLLIDAHERTCLVARQAHRIGNRGRPPKSLAYTGGWVRRGMVLVPAMARPIGEEAA